MNKSNWKNIAELIGIATIVASLVFVGFQMKQAQDIALNEVSLGVYSTGMEIRTQLSEHADIWIRGSRGEELDDVEALVFANLMQSLNHHAFWSTVMRHQLGEDASLPVEIYNFARILHENPGAREHWMDWQEAFQPYRALRSKPLKSASFSGRVREALELMDEM